MAEANDLVRSPLRLIALLMVAERSMHGYALLGRLADAGVVERSNPGRVYRALHWLADQGLAVEAWDTDTGYGPARRVYSVTPAGRNVLDVEVGAIRHRLQAKPLPWPEAQKYVDRRLRGLAQQRIRVHVEVDVVVRAGSVDAAGQIVLRGIRSTGEVDLASVVVR